MVLPEPEEGRTSKFRDSDPGRAAQEVLHQPSYSRYNVESENVNDVKCEIRLDQCVSCVHYVSVVVF